MKTAKEFFKEKNVNPLRKMYNNKITNDYIVTPEIMDEYWNEAIEAAAENANVVSTNGEFGTIHDSVNGIKVNKQSILKLKK